MTIKNPMHPDDITPEWITHALREGGVLKNASAKTLTKDILGQGVGFLSSVVRVGIEYDTREDGAPESVVMKIVPEVEALREFDDDTHAFQREIRFYREVAGNVPMRLARLYYAVDEPPAYSMIMEDLSAFTPGDQVVGMHEKQVMDTVEELARLQAAYWNNEALRELDWMPFVNNVSADFPEKWVSFVEHFGHYLDREGIKLGDRLSGYIDWKNREIEGRPKTIVHSDLREDNLLFAPPGSTDSILILDWQLAVRSVGAFDVARVMGGSELPVERKGHQLRILKKWYDTLLEQGVSGYTWEDAVYDFRLSSLSVLCFPVHFHDVFIGAGGRTKELGKAIATRLFSSAVELDAGSVLPG